MKKNANDTKKNKKDNKKKQKNKQGTEISKSKRNVFCLKAVDSITIESNLKGYLFIIGIIMKYMAKMLGIVLYHWIYLTIEHPPNKHLHKFSSLPDNDWL